MRYSRSRVTGFTLIELMISLVIGTIVVGAGISLYVQTSASRNLLRAELALQENSYYIDQTLRQLINQAGHRPLITSLLSTPLLPIKVPEQSFDEASGSTESDGSDAGTGNSDAGSSWEKGQYIRIEDNGIAIRFNGASDDSGDADGTLIDCQGTAIAEDETADIALTVSDGALLCTSDGNSVELISETDGVSVEQIAVLWGLDTNNDRSVDEYQLATNSMSTDEALLSVRILMLLSSRDEVSLSNSSYAFNGVEYTSSDSRLRREASTTVQIKN